MGLTLNLGNYEAAKISVTVELPCAPEDCEETYNDAVKFVEEKVAKEAAKIRSAK